MKKKNQNKANLTYTSSNGYTGVLYGNRSMSVFDSNDHEVMHTGFRSVNTADELAEFVDNFDQFLKDFKKEMKIAKKIN